MIQDTWNRNAYEGRGALKEERLWSVMQRDFETSGDF